MRFAEPEDYPRLWQFCEVMHADNGVFRLAPHKVISLLKRACWKPGQPPAAIIGIINGPERVEAAVCLDLMQHWYSDDWFYADRFLYVHPAHRRSRHASKLFTFCERWHKMTDLPLVISIETLYEREAKERLYGRYARRVGASFVFGKLPMERIDAECARVAADRRQ